MAGTENTRERRPPAPARFRVRWGSGLFLAASALAAIAVACLPDLADIPPDTTAFESGVGPFVGCGDGVIASLDDGGDAGESCDPNSVDAQVPGCRSCQLECPSPPRGKLDPTSGHCYFVARSESTYSGANSLCQVEGAHVVTLGSAAEVDFVKSLLVPGDDVAGYWVGLSRVPALGSAYGPSHLEEPGFPYPAAAGAAAGPCAGCFGLGADPDAGAFPLEDASSGDAPCVVARVSSWLQVECNKGPPRAVLCEREPLGFRAYPCGGALCFSLVSTSSTKTYLVDVSAADPDQAARSCAALDGGSLVVLDSAEEREQLAHEILALDPNAVEQQLWIGLSADAGTWTWGDGVAASARPLVWGNAQPATPDSGAARAFMRLRGSGLVTPVAAYDTQLAYADDGARTPRLYICQRRR